jgi:Zn-dependent metalloprotease
MRFKLFLFGMTMFGFAFSQTNTFYALDNQGKWLMPTSKVTTHYFEENQLEILGLTSQNHLEIVEVLQDEIGMTHTKYQQFYMGYPVEGAIVILHEKNGLITSINGQWVKDFNESFNASVAFEKALEAAKTEMPAKNYYWDIPEMEALLKRKEKNANATFYPSSHLVLASESFSNSGADYALNYKIDLYGDGKHNHKIIYVNANDASIDFSLEQCHEGAANGVAETRYSGTQNIITDSVNANEYILHDNTRGGGIHVLNANNSFNFGTAVEFTDSNNYWNNANAQMNDAATDAYWGLQMTYDYFDQKHNRKSYDDNDSEVLAYVHVDNNWFNASWNGQFIQFGDGSSNPLTHIDVAAHELAHGVTGTSANLVYAYESGALNESFSDIFGNATEFFALGDSASWLIGTENFTLRDMSNPKSYGNPDTYKGQFWEFGSFDNGGVHINSGVQNYWFYLLSEGGTGTNDNGDAYAVTKIGMDTAGAIAYRNLAYYLSVNSQYNDARIGSMLSAVDLYGSCSTPVEQVLKAWYAVGIGPNGFTDDFDALYATTLESGCDLGASETLSMVAKYNPSGCTSQIVSGDTLYFNYRLNGNVIKEAMILNGAPAAGDTFAHTFSTLADFSQSGIYTIDYWVSNNHDLFPENDSVTNSVVKNIMLLNDSVNTINFDDAFVYESYSYIKTGASALAIRRPGIASNQSLFGFQMSSTDFDTTNLVIPTTPADNFVLNPQYETNLCACVDATNWNNVSLSFDAKQTYSQVYQFYTGTDLPEYASSLRVLVNGNAVSPQLHPATYISDPYYSHSLNLDAFAGKTFTMCFQGKHWMPTWFDPIPGSPGDNTYLDNIILEDKFVLSVSEEAKPEYAVYPNPADEVVYIETKNIEGSVSVIDGLGRVVKTHSIDKTESTLKLDIDQLKAGVYYLQIKNGNETFTEKLILL